MRARDIAWFREMLVDAQRRRSWHAAVLSGNATIRALETVAPERSFDIQPSSEVLAGLPVGVKDLISVNGLPTTAGSRFPTSIFEAAEAVVVQRLRAAGAVVLGKTKTDEFAYAAPPDTVNPHDSARTPGGSSAGSAAAVAAGFCPIALGTQTSRSIIAPASFCGIVGFKPSFGRIPRDGVVLLAPSMDTVGVLANSVSDVETVCKVVFDEWQEPEPRSCRWGIPSEHLLEQILAGCSGLDPFKRAISELSTVTVPFRWEKGVDTVYRNGMDLLHGEMAEVHREWVQAHRASYREITLQGIERGQAIDAARLASLKEWALSFRQEVEEDMRAAGVDVLLLPSQPSAAPLLGGATGFGHTTTPWSAAGIPCLSIPELEVDGLGLGLQGISTFGNDEALLRWMSIWPPARS